MLSSPRASRVRYGPYEIVDRRISLALSLMAYGNGLLPIPLHGEGSSMDQDEGSNKTPGYLGILPDLLPYNNLSKSRDTCTPRLLDYIKEAWVDP